MKVQLNAGNYFGVSLKQSEATNFYLSETKYHANSLIPSHFHENFYICYVVKGDYSETYTNKNIECTQDDIIIHPGFLEHSNKFSSPGVCFNIEIKKLNEWDYIIKDVPHGKFSQSGLMNNIKKAYREFKFNDEFSPLVIEGLILETLGLLGREKKSLGPYWLNKAKQIIAANRFNTISLSTVASSLSISPAHLAREFKKSMGISIGEYIQQVRIEEACRLLNNKNKDLLEISLFCGFADQSHFTRTFKKLMGITPAAYRRSIML